MRNKRGESVTITEKFNKLGTYKEKIERGGGEEKVKKQHVSCKLTARERINFLLDHGSFVEINEFVSHRATELGMDKIETPAEGVITGYGKIAGRLIYIFAQDFTVMGGTLGEMHAFKICKILELALKSGAPVIGINDSGGARIQEGVDALNGYGEIFKRNVMASGVIPQISVILGPCAGGAVYSPALTDFVFMIEKTSKMFITGPKVVRAVTFEDVTAEELGGTNIHMNRSGVAHIASSTEEECFQKVRELLGYLPSNCRNKPPRRECVNPSTKDADNLKKVVPEDPKMTYDVRDVLSGVLDKESFFEIQEDYACNVITGFARLGGWSVGVIANQPQFLAGCLDINSSDKAARFIRFCDAFQIPLLTFVDTPGYLPGTKQEHNGIIRHGAKVLYAYSEATVPKLTVILRKAYGGAYIAMCARSLGADLVLSWPTAEIAVMGPEGAADIIFKKEILRAENPSEFLEQKVKEYRDHFASPYVAARRGYVDKVISPHETRHFLQKSLEALVDKHEKSIPKRHGNIPL